MVQRLRRRLVQARRTGRRARAPGAVSTGDLRPAARVLAARRGTKTDVPRGSHVPATQELGLQPPRRGRCLVVDSGQDRRRRRVEDTEGAGNELTAARHFGAFVRLVHHTNETINPLTPIIAVWVQL